MLKDGRERSTAAVSSRLCAMNPRMAIDCMACAVMPTALQSVAVATQNKITDRAH
jgi:hypothetical protein